MRSCTTPSSGGNVFIPCLAEMIHKYCFLLLLCCFIALSSGSRTGCSPLKVQSPGFPLNYPSGLQCSWLLTSKDNATIVLFSVSNIRMEKCNRPCGCDYLEIFDGATTSSKSLGKFCDGKIRMFSSGRHMLIVFHTDKTGSASGFSASYRNISRNDVCSKTSETIASKFQFFGNINCNWLLDAGSGNMVVMDRFTLAFGYCNDCSCGRLEAFDSESDSEARLGSWCSTPIPDLISTGRYMYVKYVAKPYSKSQRFKAYYKSIKNQTVCARLQTTATSGIIKSYDYPSKYIRGKVECFWHIAAAKDQLIRLTVETLDINSCRDCGYLQIFDGKSTYSPTFGKWYSGTVDLVSSQNYMIVAFTTTEFATAKGLEARYYVIGKNKICKEAPENKGSISSYDYPNPYPGNFQCTWLISSFPGNVIRLTTGNLDFPTCYGKVCDYLDVYDGATKNHPRLARFKSGQEVDLVSTADKLFIEFKSMVVKKIKGLRGFHAQYYSLKRSEVCPESGNLYATRDEKSFTSRNYPNPYWGNVYCSWRILADSDYVIRLTVQALSFEECEPNCNCDYLEVFNGSSANSNSLGKWCGHDTPDLLSSGRYMFVIMRTNLFNSGRGFKAVYYKIHKSEVCPMSGLLRHRTGIIHSPGYPQKYKGSHTCVWIIEASPNKVIHLHTRSKNLKLQKCGLPTTCTCDYLEIFDGLSMNASMGRWCRTELDILSSGRFLKLVFRSNEDTGGGAFEIEYLTFNRSKVCPKDEESKTAGSISSFNYPGRYSGNIDCLWILKAPHEESVIHFVFQDFLLDTCDSSLPCTRCSSKLQAFETSQSSQIIPYEPWCRDETPQSMFFHGSQLTLKFQTSKRTYGKGFLVKYRYVRKNLGCRGTGLLKKSSGKLEGPDFPFGQIPEYFCAWQIEIAGRNKIRVSVTYKSKQEHLPCSKHYVEIFDGPFPTNQSLGRICLNTAAQDVISTGPSVYVMFWIDSNRDEENRPIFFADYAEITAPESSSNSLSTGVIVGIVVGALVFIGIIFAWLVGKYLRGRRRGSIRGNSVYYRNPNF